MINLQKLFDEIPIPKPSEANDSLVSAMSIEDGNPHRLGKDANGLPIVLISAKDGSSTPNYAPIVLENLKVAYSVTCRIQRVDGSLEEGKFTILQCTSHERILQTFFLHVISTILVSFSKLPTEDEVSTAIRTFVELFRSLTKPPRESVQGLWAELYLIARSKKPSMLLDAWHITPEARFDFALEYQNLEVKSTSGSIRQHHFSLEQLQSPPETETLIASMFVERSQAGKSIWELLLQIRSKCADRLDLVLRLDEVVSYTLGDNWRKIMDERFSDKIAKQSLQFFRAVDVPAVSSDLPAGVSNVRFLSDLSSIMPIDVFVYRAKSGLFRWAL